MTTAEPASLADAVNDCKSDPESIASALIDALPFIVLHNVQEHLLQFHIFMMCREDSADSGNTYGTKETRNRARRKARR
jgi:hypothetical protein